MTGSRYAVDTHWIVAICTPRSAASDVRATLTIVESKIGASLTEG